ncbi:MAG: MobP3 family relaxase [Oscillospiraceae bacterium]|jgi:hypothetical protein
MARLIQKSGYIKNGKATGYMEYVATRDGVEIIKSTEPVTKKQEQFIKRLLKDFLDAKELFEYGDYLQTPNRGTASAFIAVVLDTHLHEVESESGYMSYIAQRPRAEKHGGHGLFSEADTTDLKAAKAELKAHSGKVWTFIFSLRREDAECLGYNKAAAWQNLLKQESAAIAEAMRIQTDDIRWYAAYHDEGHHPHVHMMVWSAEPEKGYLTREGIAAMRSRMTNAIFHEEMKELYIKKDAAYKESIQTAKESLLLYIRMLENSESADPVIEQKLRYLSQTLEQVDGKHVYGYLPKEVKAQVDEIVEQLAQLPEVAACYDQWWRLKDEIAGYYGRNTLPHQPLVLQKEFRAIKNFIIREAETIREPTPVQTNTDAEPSEPQKPLNETPTAVQQPQIAPLQNALTADAVMQLLHHMSRMFRGNMPVIPPALRIDSKRRRRLQEKRMAMGRKWDDHEDEQLHHVNDNTMR